MALASIHRLFSLSNVCICARIVYHNEICNFLLIRYQYATQDRRPHGRRTCLLQKEYVFIEVINPLQSISLPSPYYLILVPDHKWKQYYICVSIFNSQHYYCHQGTSARSHTVYDKIETNYYLLLFFRCRSKCYITYYVFFRSCTQIHLHAYFEVRATTNKLSSTHGGWSLMLFLRPFLPLMLHLCSCMYSYYTLDNKEFINHLCIFEEEEKKTALLNDMEMASKHTRP